MTVVPGLVSPPPTDMRRSSVKAGSGVPGGPLAQPHDGSEIGVGDATTEPWASGDAGAAVGSEGEGVEGVKPAQPTTSATARTQAATQRMGRR